jgi:mono/diheme cytochrome c family protein
MTDNAKTIRYRFLTASLAMFLLGMLVGCSGMDSHGAPIAFQQGNVARGEYLSKVFCCRECHTPRLPGGSDDLNRNLLLAGGVPFPGPEGSLVYSANVTIAGPNYSEETLDNLIRGRLAFKFAMPTHLLNGMSTDDMRDLIAYLKTLKPVGPPLPDPHLPPGYVLPPPNPAMSIPPHEPPIATGARGEYLARVFLCRDCHSSPDSPGTAPQHHYLEGGYWPLAGISIFAPNLTPDVATGLGAWSDAEIKRTIRTGIARDGRRLNSFMPSLAAYHDMTDQDGSDLVLYLRSLKPVKVSPQFATH